MDSRAANNHYRSQQRDSRGGGQKVNFLHNQLVIRCCLVTTLRHFKLLRGKKWSWFWALECDRILVERSKENSVE